MPPSLTHLDTLSALKKRFDTRFLLSTMRIDAHVFSALHRIRPLVIFKIVASPNHLQ